MVPGDVPGPAARAPRRPRRRRPPPEGRTHTARLPSAPALETRPPTPARDWYSRHQDIDLSGRLDPASRVAGVTRPTPPRDTLAAGPPKIRSALASDRLCSLAEDLYWRTTGGPLVSPRSLASY